jgi:hypothetical protein
MYYYFCANLLIREGAIMKIDIYSHIMPKKYTELYAKKNSAIEQRIEFRSIAVVDLDVRLRLMNRYPDVLQVLTVANIPLETFAPKKRGCCRTGTNRQRGTSRAD